VSLAKLRSESDQRRVLDYPHFTVKFILGVLMTLLLSPDVSWAQSVARVVRPAPPDESRIFIDVNVSGASSPLSGSREFTSRFVKFAEIGSIVANYPAPNGELSPLLDVGGTFMLKRFLGVGASYNRVSYEDSVTVSATIPHPSFYAAPASHSASTDRTLERVEASTNIFMTVALIRSNQLQVRLLGGPSFMSYRADMVQDVSYDQTAAPSLPQNSITINGFTSASAEGSNLGFHVGGDVAYFFSKLFGVTGGVRFSDALVTLDEEPLSGVTQKVRVGGTMVFVGARVRLGG
jgi:hypothetical protein